MSGANESTIIGNTKYPSNSTFLLVLREQSIPMSTCTKILFEGTLPISTKIIGSAVIQSPHQSVKVSFM